MTASVLNKEVRVECSLAHAFATFTARIDLWWPASHRPDPKSTMGLEAEPGGAFYAETSPGNRVHLGDVVDCDPPDRIRYTWFPGGGVGPTEVEVRFVAEGESTVVLVEHRIGESQLGEEWPKRAAGFARAWDQVLPAFAIFASAG